MRYGFRLIAIGAAGIILDLVLVALTAASGGQRSLSIAFFLGCAFMLLGVLRVAWIARQDARRGTNE